jgi:fluoride exporter
MKQTLIVGAGGFLGAILRFRLGLFVLEHAKDWRFPLHTVVVNVSGCLIAGILAGLVAKHQFFGVDMKVFLFAGILGGFTTFSAFGLETVSLLQRQEFGTAMLNVVISVSAGMLAIWIGMRAAT